MQSKKNGRILKSTTRSFEIVDALVELEGARTSEVAEYLDISKSSVSNHLKTLQESGYVTSRGDIYYPGLKFAYIGEYTLHSELAYDITIEVIEELDEKTPFVNTFIVEENGVGRHLTPEVNKPERYDRYAFPGQKEYLHAIAAGKAILAELPDEYVESIIEQRGLPAKTENTITSRNELFHELAEVRELGYAVNRSENREGQFVLAKAVNRPNGTVLGAIAVASQRNRIREERFKPRIIDILREYTKRVEQRLEREL
jgi:DNA-binding IclR family transcriptional regulator